MSIGISRFIPTDYTGPNQNFVPIRFFPRIPTTTDKKYRVGQVAIISLNPSSGTQGDIWYLSKFDSNGDAIWIQLLSGSSTPGVDEMTTDDGSPSVKPDVNSNINILGGSGVAVTGNGPGDTVTVSATGAVSQSFPTDSGTATPAAGVLTVTGGVLLGTTGAGSTLTVNADDNVIGSIVTDAGTATAVTNVMNLVGAGGASTAAVGDTITVTATGGGLIPWTEVTVTGPTAMSINNGYAANNVASVGLSLPAVAAFGSVIEVAGKGSGGWQITQGAGQTILQFNKSTTVGAGGDLASSESGSYIRILCTTANTTWTIISSSGNLLFT